MNKEQLIDRITGELEMPLTDAAFTRRYMLLMRAYREGVINSTVKNEGLDFLLDCWEYSRENLN